MTKIQILENIDELTIPTISLTQSRNGQTGTATFFFRQPNAFNNYLNSNYVLTTIQQVSLISEKRRIQTFEIRIHFLQGQPFILESVFIFLNKNDWYSFFEFINAYSKEKGLFYSDFRY